MNPNIIHYGTKRHSGRYPWGSGGELLSTTQRLSAEGLSEIEIALGLGISTTELRNQKTLAKLEKREAQRIFVVREKNNGLSISAISRETGIAESTIRDLLKPGANSKFRLIKRIADVLKAAVEKYKFIDVGEGVEQFLGVTGIKMKNAIALLKNEGYTVHYLREEQLGTGKRTSFKVLAAPDTKFRDVFDNRSTITIPNHTSQDGGESFDAPMPIKNVSLSRIKVVKDGNKDGLIEIRPGVDDLTMGNKSYAQVRIGVDGTHYIKGVAVYNSDNLDPGQDIVFYTSKSVPKNTLRVLKEQAVNEVNPFGTTIDLDKQYFYTDNEGVKQPSALNLVYKEGDWSEWNKSLSSQFLSKQNPALAKQQLTILRDRRKAELDEIMSLTNDTVKRHLLMQYSDLVDSDAVYLKAAALPRQTTNVIIPESSLKTNEVYAPNYKNGDEILLIRYPHGGIFEIPRLVVNNKNQNAKQNIGSDAIDAIAIHPETARKLSGADFDGDTVIAIPSNPKIRTSPSLNQLKDFDPRLTYPEVSGMKPMSPEGKQRQMGVVSNLITDMTIRGAPQADIARAVRHSMVVIDAEKHRLNYRQSYIDNGIAALKNAYQDGGASTIISRASSETRIPQRKDNYSIDPQTGEKIFSYTGKTYVNKDGVTIIKRQKSTRLFEEADARKLSSGTRIERVYAEHANSLKGYGNAARKATISIKPQPYNPSARKTYQKEFDSLNTKLRLAQKNQPLERKAQLVAGELYRAIVKNNPNMSGQDRSKARGRSLVLARVRIGARKPLIEISNREWEAIQMGAISPTKLLRILRNSDMDKVRTLATPRAYRGISSGKITRATNLIALGYTRAEVAAAIGVSVSQLNNIDFKD